MVNLVDSTHATPLNIAENLFQEFSNSNISYCHWKSNEHLLQGLAGDTDLDILVDRKYSRQCENVLTSLRYKRVLSQPWATYPGIEDWLGFDDNTGKLVHIHLHYRLWSGRQYVKERRLPWEQMLLDSAVEDGQYQVLIADPNIEIILLVIRAALKASYYDRMRAILLNRISLPRDIIREFEYLHARIDHELTRNYARRMLGDDTGTFVTDVVVDRTFLSSRGFSKLLHRLPRSLAQYRRYSAAKTLLIYLRFAIYHKYMGLKGRLGYHVAQRKRFHTGGAVIAIIGADGSGKSTVTAEITKWLGWKLSVRRIYFGTGNGDVGISLLALKWLAVFRRRCIAVIKGESAKQHSNRGNSSPAPPAQRGLRGLAESFYCFLSARQRVRKALLAATISGQGEIVVADRYPQCRINGIFDGPPSPPAKSSWFIKLMYKYISSCYRRIGQLPPGLVIRLNVSEEAALGRKPDHSADEIKRKIELISSIFYDSDLTFDIDASEPLADVVLNVKRAIWESL